MDQLLSVFVGNSACDAGLAYLQFEANQIYDENDPINHNLLFKQHQTLTIPRALFLGNNQELYAGILNTNLSGKPQQALQDQQEVRPLTMSYLKEVHLNKEHYYFTPKVQDIETFCSQQSALTVEDVYERLNHQLEQMNRCNGFQIMIDVDTFSSLGKSVIDILRDLSPNRPILCSSINQNSMQEHKYMADVNLLSRLLALMHYSEITDVYVPFQLPLKTNYFTKSEDPFLDYQQFSLMYSSLTLPFSVKESQVGFEAYMHRMSIFRSCNIFNVLTRIPSIEDKPEHSIINHKAWLPDKPYLKPNYLQRIVRYEPNYRSYAESYALRGVTEGPEQAPSALGLDIRIVDDVFTLPQVYPPGLFTERVINEYGFKDQKDVVQLTSLPYHSTMFSNECYKFNLKNFQNQLEQISYKALNQFEKDGYRKDDHHELLQQFEQRIEAYGCIDEDDDN